MAFSDVKLRFLFCIFLLLAVLASGANAAGACTECSNSGGNYESVLSSFVKLAWNYI